MRANLTHANEDYLKAIYTITIQNKARCCDERASTNQIAEALGVTPASVTGMIKKLSETAPPLVEYQQRRGVLLTWHGEQIALEILRHHRLLEMFLHQMLGYGWDEVHTEADRLEHVISEEFEERLAQALGDPLHDPHGDPIPLLSQGNLYMPETPCRPLSDMRPEQQAVVCRVNSNDPELLRFLASLGLKPQAHLKVIHYSPYDKNLSLLLEGRQEPFVLGAAITEQIFVSVEDIDLQTG